MPTLISSTPLQDRNEGAAQSITSFQGEYRWLSNFWPAPVSLDGVVYPSVEHAYQAAKTDPCLRAPFLTCTPGEAKRLGRFAPIRPEWERIKIQTMRDLIGQKFTAGMPLAEKLIATARRELVEGNTWGDVFWGVCRGRGDNWLGRLLMARRDHLIIANVTPQPHPESPKPEPNALLP